MKRLMSFFLIFSAVLALGASILATVVLAKGGDEALCAILSIGLVSASSLVVALFLNVHFLPAAQPVPWKELILIMLLGIVGGAAAFIGLTSPYFIVQKWGIFIALIPALIIVATLFDFTTATKQHSSTTQG